MKSIRKPVAKKSASLKNTDSFTARQFVERLEKMKSTDELAKIQRYFKSGEGDYSEGDIFIGVKMGSIFKLAKDFMNMEMDEIEKLLEHKVHEVRTGGVSIMDFQARNIKTPESRRKELFDLYINRHDRINNWDLVDRSAPYVVGGYLFNKPRKILYKLAVSKNIWERRTAIVSTYYFIRKGEVEDTFKIAKILLKDKHDLIHKATGGWIREAGKKDPLALKSFLDEYATVMSRTTLRYAIEHMSKTQRERYLKMKP